MAKKKRIVSFTLDADLADKLESLAVASGVSRSSLVEKFIRDSIDQEGATLKAMANPMLREALVKLFGKREMIGPLAEAFGNPLSIEQTVQIEKQAPSLLNDLGKLAEEAGKFGHRRRKKRSVQKRKKAGK